jgi:hypothetical protein
MLSELDSHGGCIGDAPPMARLTAQPLAWVSTLHLGRHQPQGQPKQRQIGRCCFLTRREGQRWLKLPLEEEVDQGEIKMQMQRSGWY